jgi:hypothetical protein
MSIQSGRKQRTYGLPLSSGDSQCRLAELDNEIQQPWSPCEEFQMGWLYQSFPPRSARDQRINHQLSWMLPWSAVQISRCSQNFDERQLPSCCGYGRHVRVHDADQAKPNQRRESRASKYLSKAHNPITASSNSELKIQSQQGVPHSDFAYFVSAPGRASFSASPTMSQYIRWFDGRKQHSYVRNRRSANSDMIRWSCHLNMTEPSVHARQ